MVLTCAFIFRWRLFCLTRCSDWEYPGVQGAGNNQVSSTDSARFLTFLQLLRAQLPESAKLTAATQVTPFAGPDGTPMRDVSAFAQVLDWILIMNYDIWGGKHTLMSLLCCD